MLFVPFGGYLSVGRLHSHNIRERRIARRIECLNTITITRIRSESGVRETRNVGADLRYLRKVGAVLTGTPLDAEALLVA